MVRVLRSVRAKPLDFLNGNFFRMTHANADGSAIQMMNMSNSKKRKAGPGGAKTADAKAAKADAGDYSSSDATWLNQAETFARREPTKAVVSAVGAGFLLNLLPTRAILGAVAAVVFAVARPALLFLGMLKFWEICPCKKEPKV